MNVSKVWESVWSEGQEAIHSQLGSQDVTYLSLHPTPLPPRVQVKGRKSSFCPPLLGRWRQHLHPSQRRFCGCRKGDIFPHTIKIFTTVEGLYCKRPIQCLASSEILRNIDLPSPHRSASVWVPPRLWCGQGVDTLAGRRGGGGSIVRKTPDTVLYSIYVSTLCSPPTTLYSLEWQGEIVLYMQPSLASFAREGVEGPMQLESREQIECSLVCVHHLPPAKTGVKTTCLSPLSWFWS